MCRRCWSVFFLSEGLYFLNSFLQNRQCTKDLIDKFRKVCAIAWLYNVHHDNAPTHMALRIRKFLTNTKKNTSVHLPCDFLCFRLERYVKSKRISDINDVNRKFTASRKGIKEYKFEKFFQQRKDIRTSVSVLKVLFGERIKFVLTKKIVFIKNFRLFLRPPSSVYFLNFWKYFTT